jgi:hypothetical protein
MPRKKNKPLDGFVITRARYVVNQKAPVFADRRNKRLTTRGAKNRYEIALNS